MKLRAIYETITPQDILDFYGMIGSDVDWDAYGPTLVATITELYETIRAAIKARIICDFAPRQRMGRGSLRPSTPTELYQSGLGSIEMCKRVGEVVARADDAVIPDVATNQDVDAIIRWFRNYQQRAAAEGLPRYHTVTSIDGLWIKAWGLVKDIEDIIYNGNIYQRVVAADRIIQLAHHDGTMMSYLQGQYDDEVANEYQRILDRKFQARDITEFWREISEPIRIMINKQRHRAGEQIIA